MVYNINLNNYINLNNDINNKDNTFTEKAGEYGIDDDGYSMHSTFLIMTKTEI